MIASDWGRGRVKTLKNANLVPSKRPHFQLTCFARSITPLPMVPNYSLFPQYFCWVIFDQNYNLRTTKISGGRLGDHMLTRWSDTSAFVVSFVSQSSFTSTFSTLAFFSFFIAVASSFNPNLNPKLHRLLLLYLINKKYTF